MSNPVAGKSLVAAELPARRQLAALPAAERQGCSRVRSCLAEAWAKSCTAAGRSLQEHIGAAADLAERDADLHPEHTAPAFFNTLERGFPGGAASNVHTLAADHWL